MERKRTKKKYIVIPAAALALLGIGTGAVLANDMKKVLGGNFNAGIISNFTLLNDEIVRYLVENNIGCGISLDGTIHSKVDINGNSTSKKVMEHLEWFLDEGCRCNILTVLTDTNVETGEILELAKFVVKHDLPWQVNSDIFVMLGNDTLSRCIRMSLKRSST